ncbi:MAG: hemerythrin domain-containing protein [Acidobacteria bacterium]|nr:hemerythrin domain-containing protein [Acidobacteriota bacterium]
MKSSALLDRKSLATSEKELRNEHRRLEQLANRLQTAKELPALLSAAEELRQALLSHHAHEEHPGGFYDSLKFSFPQHNKELARLMQEHRDLTAAVWELCQRAGDLKPRLPALRKEAAQFIKKLRLHEKIEHEIAHRHERSGQKAGRQPLPLDRTSLAQAEKKLRNEHRRLGQLAELLQAANDLPALLSTAEKLRKTLMAHFAHEEDPGGLYDSLEFCLPQHRKELAQLTQDHRDLSAAVWELCQRARDPKPRFPVLRKEVAQFIRKLHLHEKLEHEIARQPLEKSSTRRD